MAEGSIVGKLAEKPFGVQLGILGGVLLVVGLLYYQTTYSPGADELDSVRATATKLQIKQKELLQREVEWKELLKAKNELESTLNTNQISLPHTADLNSFIDHLQGQATVAGVSFKSWKRQSEIAVARYVKVPIAVEVMGNFHQILKYFFLLGDVDTTKRIIAVENFNLVQGKNFSENFLLKVSFQATAFRQADGAKPFRREEDPGGMETKTAIDKIKDAKNRKRQNARSGDNNDRARKANATVGLDRLKNPGAN